MLRRFLFSCLATFLAVLLLVSVGRSLLDSLLVRWDEAAAVHRDRSQFATGVLSEAAPDVMIVYRNQDGRRVRVLADAADYSAFARAAFARLEAAREATSSAIRHAVTTEFMPLEAAAHERVPRYADWYFAWGTSYRLLYEAGKSTLQHALEPSALSLQASVTADVGAYIRHHYEERVLEPEISDALLRQAFARAYLRAHARYASAIAELDQSFQRFVAEKTTHLDDGPGDLATAIVVDWGSQLHKLKLANHEKGGLGAIGGAGSVAALAAIGAKIVGAARRGENRVRRCFEGRRRVGNQAVDQARRPSRRQGGRLGHLGRHRSSLGDGGRRSLWRRDRRSRRDRPRFRRERERGAGRASRV
jgi:hypothetical protein